MKLIYSNHALERVQQRLLNQDDIALTVAQPDKKFPTDKADQFKFIKTIRGRRYQVVAKSLPNQDAWLVISAWVRGEEDPESLLTTIILAPFRLIGEIIKYLWQKKRPQKASSQSPKKPASK